MDNIILQLKESPTESQVDELISKLLREENAWVTPNSQSLDLFSTIINQTLPQFDINPSLIDLFKCLPGISSLVARIATLAQVISEESKLSDQVISCSHMNLLCDFLVSIMRPGNVLVVLLERYGDANPKLFNRELISLFAGSKLFESVSMANHYLNQYDHQLVKDELKRFDKWKYFSIGSEYTKYLVDEICSVYNSNITRPDKLQFLAELLEKSLKLGFPTVIAEELITKPRLSIFLDIFNHLRPTSKWHVIETSIIPFFQQKYIIDSPITLALSVILQSFLKSCISPPIFKFAESIKINFNTRVFIVNAAFCSNKSHFEQQFTELLAKWGNPLSINHNPEIIQEAQTQLLVLSLSYLDKPFLERVSSSKEYLDAISNRLSALTDRIRLFGTIFAEQLSKKIDSKPLTFGLKDLYDDDLNNWLKVATIYITQSVNIDEALKMLEKYHNEREITKSIEQLDIRDTQHENPDTTLTIADDSDTDDEDPNLRPYPFPENDEEDSDDDPTLAQKSRPSRPVYIKDLLLYLQEEDYNKNYLALTHGAELIRRKARFGQELELYAKPLANQLAGMKDSFDMDKFNENRLILLSTLVASCPTIVPSYLSELVFSADYSLQQRINILSSITLGARELSGLKPADQYDIVTPQSKLLPPEVHKLFYNPEDSITNNNLTNHSLELIDNVTSDLRNELLQATSQQAKDELIGGPKILRISSKLVQQRKNNQQSTVTHSITNKYAKLASRHFFSPLITQFYASGGIHSIGTYSDLLSAHFCKTLALLLHASYPSSPDIPSMTGELLDLLLNQRTSAISSLPILDSLLTGLLIILETNAPEFLITTFSRQMVEFKLWLEDNWQSIPSEKTQTFAAGVLYKLTDLMAKWERHLLGEFTSLEGTL